MPVAAPWSIERTLGLARGSAAFRVGRDGRRSFAGFLRQDVHHVLLPVVLAMQPEALPEAIPAAQPQANGLQVELVQDCRCGRGNAGPVTPHEIEQRLATELRARV